jgi:hypothetical protein
MFSKEITPIETIFGYWRRVLGVSCQEVVPQVEPADGW